jgi:hypothetical protein
VGQNLNSRIAFILGRSEGVGERVGNARLSVL